jgi:hypothetical protein
MKAIEEREREKKGGGSKLKIRNKLFPVEFQRASPLV